MGFEIGLTEAVMVTLESLGIANPLATQVDYSQNAERADALVSGLGWGVCSWRWLYLDISERNLLKTSYCTGKSAIVFIETLKPDRTFGIYRVAMIWPDQEIQRSGKVLDFLATFRLLEEL